MNSRLIMTAICLFGCGNLFAQSKVLFNSDFEQDSTLKGWVSALKTGETPPDTAQGLIASESVDGKINHFYRGFNGSFGVSAILENPYKVGNDTVTIEIKARVRGNGDSNFAKLDLSSLESPIFPFQYSQGKSAGFGVGGYRHANDANNIYYYKNTKTPIVYSEKSPFLPDEAWHSWRLVYDHVANTLSLYFDNVPEPLLVQKDVNLGGVEFRSLWFMGSQFGSDYDDIVVSVVEKDVAAIQQEPVK